MPLRTFVLAASILVASLAPVGGCLLVAGAAIGAGALVVTGDDSVEAHLDKPFDAVYAAAVDELKKRGTITVQTKEFGKLEANVVVPNDSHAVVKIERLGDASVKLTVSARKLAKSVPDRTTAEAIATSIIEVVSGGAPSTQS